MVLVSRKPVFDPLQQNFGLVLTPLKQDFWIVFFTDYLRQLSNKEYQIEQPEHKNYPELRYFTQGMERLTRELSQTGEVAYIETDLFGGLGRQAAALFQNGELLLPPQEVDCFTQWVEREQRPINQVLRRLGVQKQQAEDEFSALGLDLFQSNPEFPSLGGQ